MVTIVFGCGAKVIPLSEKEQKLEKQLSLKYDCKVTLTIDERSVELHRNDGVYNIEFDFTGSQNLCKMDSLTIMEMVDYSYDHVVNTISFKKNHEFIMIGFTEIVKVGGIETSHCMKSYQLNIDDGSLVTHPDHKNRKVVQSK